MARRVFGHYAFTGISRGICTQAPGTTVAQIANRWGITHLGRLAAAYRTRYGVSPSVTLRSAPPPTLAGL